ncbi:phosphatidylserine/phosphatidylglycerophosphate/cardiolipin synthase family protein [Desulfosarcina sp.]|uniref:phospholipase D-like domain-containing protein n=1 Tax=Desulfosarcina sp. TaxID=2027861 RepID=UPI0029AB14FA|nr:phosphatidylserine/phosphatidylglycerophosphate/cardiolipin synthase family protein [Desulfosarcina sp.]MDX2453929.1 phosphatidylserine/phosphatidylglycerophosphate/cardiolipin synthase family protein [Desulfosarcina sp.]MDX2491623.1 phosphatidylserine/phosphatidylglycerophosphate/cardiolipin synthase family protein [Desulfosarcina sp.]
MTRVSLHIRQIFLAVAIALVMTAIGCSPTPRYQRIPAGVISTTIEPPPVGLRFETTVTLKGTLWKDDSLLLTYSDGRKDYYGRVSADDQVNLSIHQEWFPVYQVNPLEKNAYKQSVTGAETLRHLDRQHWTALVKRIENALVNPIKPGTGILINVRDEEIFVYRRLDGSLAECDFMEKPASVRLVENHRLETMNEGIFLFLTAYLETIGVSDPHLVMETGETGPYARPFVFVDRNEKRFHFLSLEPYTFGSMPSMPVTNTGKVGWHLFARSYLFELFNRPVSSLSRLGLFLYDTAWDATRGIWISTFRFPDAENVNIPPLYRGGSMDRKGWEDHLDRVVGTGTRTSGRIELLVGGDQFFPRLVDAVIGAERSVKLRTYIFDRDDYAVRLADLLKKRSKDVNVQVMLDGLGTLMAQNKAAGSMPPDHEAPLGITLYLTDQSKVRLVSLTNPWFTGDHTKTTIIDSRKAFIGGMNIGREYRWEWHDLMMVVDGPLVSVIEREFDKTWAHGQILGDVVFSGYVLANPPTPESPRGYPIRVLRTLPYDSQVYRSQLHAIRQAKGYIFIQNAYFSDTTIIHELVKARLRGVDVRVIIPMEGNHGIMNASNVTAANTLLKYGVRVFTYPGMSHVKAAVYDGWACLGSANFDKLSFRVNKEMNLGSSDPDFVQNLLDSVFAPDFEAAVELTQPLPAGWNNTIASIIASQL